MNRRNFVMAGGLVLAGSAAGAAVPQLRQAPKARVIVDNDFAGDPDGLIALAHQLGSKAARTVLVTSSPLDPELARMGGLDAAATAFAGDRAARDLVAQMKMASLCPVAAGSETFGLAADRSSAAARAIVAEAMRADPLPLYFACGGPLTNLAQALQLEPAIAGRMTLVWIGGAAYPQGGHEYNLNTDLEAARFVIERSGIAIWQVPDQAYRQLQISVAEMQSDFRGISSVTQWLYGRYADLPPFVTLGGAITLGDSPLVLLTSVTAESSRSKDLGARRLLEDGRYGEEIAGRTIRVFDQLDGRLALADFLAVMRNLAASPA